MKKIFAILLLTTLVVLTSCSSNTVKTNKNNSELEEFVAYSGDEIKKVYEDALDCKCELSVNGNELVVNLYNQNIEDCSTEGRVFWEHIFNQMRSSFRESHMDLKKKAPSLEGVVLNLLEKDGDLLTQVTIDLT